jgi:hypothetical protein
MPKIENKIILKKCFLYAVKVWLVNILFLLGLYSSLSIGINASKIAQFAFWMILFFIVNSIILGGFSYFIIKSLLNHWVKKITLLLFTILLLLVISFLVVVKEEYEGLLVAIGITFLLSIPTLFSIGLFYPDKLDIALRDE